MYLMIDCPLCGKARYECKCTKEQLMNYQSRELHHEYWREERKALVYHTTKGWEVDLLKNDKLLETRRVYNHSESYAEDVGENWVDGIITEAMLDSSNPNSVGYYGYNEKTDNYDPEVDD